MNLRLKILVALFFILYSAVTSATSIVYNSLECQNSLNPNDPTPSTISIQSRFEVVEDRGGGVFIVHLTGGLPRFINGDTSTCIDSETAIGYAGIPQRDGIPLRLDSIEATAYFNGQELIITVNSIHTDLSGRNLTFSNFTTSQIRPNSNTLIFDYDEQSLTFKLKKLIRNRGFIHISGATASITPFLETIIPSFNDTSEDVPSILTPAVNIEYLLE